MTVAPVSSWASSYESKLNAYFGRSASDPSESIATFWQDWVDSNTMGIESGPPYIGAKGTTDSSSFAPVVFTPQMLSPESAKVLSDAWQSYILATVWTIPSAVAPPFSVILSVTPSALGITAAYSALLAGLTAEFSLLPPDSSTAMLTKALAISTLFYTATLASGIDLKGLATAGTPPPPVEVPYSGVL